jgi:3-hydroxyisobutyrate dehydrogenase-like beta-hydroxyacid dehydrogenase
MSDKKSVGFIGLGLMGHGMAKNLVEKGFATTVLDLNPAPVQDLVRRGAKTAATPREIAAGADFVILSLTTAEIVETVVLGDDGVLAGLGKGAVLIDTSTGAPETTAKVAAAVVAKGARYADAPLTRTPKEAEEGRLNTMVGADPETFALIKPVLAAFAENIIHIGPVGSGHKLKLINNFILLTTATVLAEAVATAKKAGVDPQKILEVCSLGAANSAMLQICMPYVLAGDESRMRFSIANAAKDMRYYAGLAASVGAPSAVTAPAVQHYQSALKDGLGDQFVPRMFDHIGTK